MSQSIAALPKRGAILPDFNERPRAESQQPLCGKSLGTVFNADDSNVAAALGAEGGNPVEYLRIYHALLDLKPGLLAQCVGFPDPVVYPSAIATSMDKHLAEVAEMLVADGIWEQHRRDEDAAGMRQLLAAGTDPLKLAVEACRARGVPVVASYRMNAEDFYQHSWRLSDFGRAHPDFRISGAGCLDPAIPEVYEQRMAIFREVAETYDIDGIEFDFRRWYHMVSNPLENHTVLTRLVHETRAMLDEVAARKGRSRMLLGVRVGPSLDSDPSPFLFPGIEYPRKPVNASCRELGLDVKTWISAESVDYVCPALFLGTLPGMPLTREFVDLAAGTSVGIYPFLCGKSAWMHFTLFDDLRPVQRTDDDTALAQYKHDLCTTALAMYEDGADGINTFNWWSHLMDAGVASEQGITNWGGEGALAIQSYVYPILGEPQALRHYLAQPWAVPPGKGNQEESAPPPAAPAATGIVIQVVENGESRVPPAACRGTLVGPGINQPDPFPGYGGFVGWESPVRLSNGDWLVTFSAGYWHASPPTPYRDSLGTIEKYREIGMPCIDAPTGGRAMYIRSTDEGRTWSKPQTLIDTPDDDRHPSVLELPDGTLLCSFFTRTGYGDVFRDPSVAYHARVVRSFDGGESWEKEATLISTPLLTGETDGPMVLMPDGSVLLCLNGTPADLSPEQGVIVRTTDGGETWKTHAILKTDHPMYETSIARMPSGRLVFIAREQGDIAWSDDGGRTWTDPIPMGMTMHAPTLYALRDGTLICLYDAGASGTARGLRVVFSLDEGHTWIAPAATHGFLVDESYGYGKAMELGDGSVFITYIKTGGHTTEEAQSNAVQCIRMRIRPDRAGIDLLPASMLG
jgi:sialidase-1